MAEACQETFTTGIGRMHPICWGAKVEKGAMILGRIRVRNFGSLRIGKNVEIRSGFSKMLWEETEGS